MMLVLLLLVAQDTDSLEKARSLVTEETLRKDVGTLASDAFEGRAAGFPGAEKAADQQFVDVGRAVRDQARARLEHSETQVAPQLGRRALPSSGRALRIVVGTT